MSSNASNVAPILLSNADYYGTLAATRSLGESGVPVWIADPRLFSVARWSKHAARALSAPPIDDGDRFAEWLVALGERDPGAVLYPTSDETTFLYARHHDALSRSFRTYMPGLDTILHVLDKRRLYATARAVGMDVPETWFPNDEADVARIAREAEMPVLIKPRTQVLSRTRSKGVVVHDRDELVARWRDFVAKNGFGDALTAHVPDAAHAMIQRYVPGAADRIHVLAAFLDREGERFAWRSGVKVLQRPRRLGIGLCFEPAAIDDAVVEAARRLARATGYFGLYQIELIRDGDRTMLIDFNPRFYNQLAFDQARGLPLAHLVHAAARGDDAEVTRLVARANAPHDGDRVFCNRFGLELILSTQRLSGAISRHEAARWRAWRERNAHRAIDPSLQRGDLLPAVVDVANQLYFCARYPRSFLRSIVLDR